MRIQQSITKPQTTPAGELKQKPYRQNFKGLDSVVIVTMDAIERGGTFASFVTQDFLGAILPRPLAGLTRNKKENQGKVNTKFALKEVIREFITGPSMFLIPMGILHVTKKHVGKALDVPAEFIKSLGDIYKDTANLTKSTDPATLKLEYYKNVFENILTTTTNQSADDIKTAADDMAGLLLKMENQGKTPFFKHLFKNEVKENTIQDTTNKLMEAFTNLTKKHLPNASEDFFNAKIMTQIKVDAENASRFEVKDGNKIINTSFKKILGHITNYANDAIEKTAKESAKGFKTNIIDFVDHFNYKRVTQRFGLNLGMTAAVIAFLSITPNLYNRSKENPGLIGLDTSPMEPVKSKGDVKNENK